MTRILIADDERPARSELRFLLEKIIRQLNRPDAEIHEAGSGAAVLELTEKVNFDVCFLDIELGDMKGTELAEKIRKKTPDAAIVFVTAYETYALNAFELDAIDYVMKPFDEVRIRKAVEKLMQRKVAVKKMPGPFALPAGDHMEVVMADSISYIEAVHKGAKVHCHKSVYFTGDPLIEWEKKLSSAGDQFVRVHKSFIVNLNACEALVPDYNNGYACKLKDCGEETIPISRNMIHEIKTHFGV
ncbi:LytR/AlgR family response regulator transcription factor [Butyrivibrio sp. WCD2001]|uniref:LytR/AlgR family response regulator transcription factor n=1 Tax=Butyrivibrio sp. WCD2001 TaxID=1280681 RepID=UPI00047C6C1F|nr:LytTR family DNA-binding domain-containing protein [Butyrivibrio sp. WCD2001]